MFDLRYHIASLAAVFIAIAIGVVIGVAIASGGEVDSVTRSIQEGQIGRLERQLEAANDRADRAQEQQQAARELMDKAYPALMANRLEGKRIAVLYVGPVTDDLQRDVEQTLTAAGAEEPASVTALTLPIDSAAIDASLASDPDAVQFSGEENLETLGRALGAELVTGADSSLWDALDTTLVEQRGGAILGSLDGVVVAQSWLPAIDADVQEQQDQARTKRLVEGILNGLRASGASVVGVASSDDDDAEARLATFKDVGISTVNDVDQLPGRLALALLLAGGDPGDYGAGEGAANGVAPPIEPLPATTAAE